MEQTVQQMVEMKAERKVNQTRMDVNQEKAEASMARLEARIDANRESDREDLKGMMAEMFGLEL
jgi:hypothetical protein